MENFMQPDVTVQVGTFGMGRRWPVLTYGGN